MHRKLLIIAGVLAVAVIILVAFYFFTQNTTQKPSFSSEKKVLSSNDIPSGFPSDFPVEAGSSVIQNYESTTNDGRKQSTRITTSNKTSQEAVKVYQEFFIARGWIEVSTLNSDPNSFKAIFRKDNSGLSVTAHEDATTKKNTVEVTLTEVETQL